MYSTSNVLFMSQTKRAYSI